MDCGTTKQVRYIKFETSQGNLLNLDNIKPGNEYKNRVRYNPLPIFKLIHKISQTSDNTYHVIREAFTDNVPGFSITYEFLNSQYRYFNKNALITQKFKRLSPKRIILSKWHTKRYDSHKDL